MTSYVFTALGLVFVVPLAVLLTPSFRGLFVHASLACFFHAMGAFALSLGVLLVETQKWCWAWLFFGVSLALYGGACLIALMAFEHFQGSSAEVITELRRKHPEERILLEVRRAMWPLVLFPSVRGNHSRVFTGRRWVHGIRAGFGLCALYLTDKRLFVQLRLPNVLLIDIARDDIGSVGFVDRERDLLGIRYSKSRVSPLTKLLVFSGSPARRDLVFLSLGHDSQQWLTALTAPAQP